VANMLVGLYSAPLNVDVVLHLRWRHGCIVELTRDLLTGFVQNFVSLWGVLLMLLHHMARLARWETPAWVTLRLHPVLVRVALMLYVLLPWLLGAFVVTPIIFTGLRYQIWMFLGFERCPIILTQQTKLVLNIITYFLPALGIIAAIVVIMVWVRAGRGTWLAVEKHSLYPTGDNDPHRVEAGSAGLVTAQDDVDPALVHVLVGVITMLLFLPQHALSLSRSFGYGNWKVELQAYVTAHILEELAPVFMPFLWLILLPDVGERRRDLCHVFRERVAGWKATCCRTRSPPTKSGLPPVSFRDLQDE